MKYTAILLSLMTMGLALWSSNTYAKTKMSFSLPESCTELINIYNNKQEKKVFVALTTSVSESLRAGYCLGVITQYNEDNGYCYSDIHQQATFIAQYSLQEERPSEQKMLSRSCNDS